LGELGQHIATNEDRGAQSEGAKRSVVAPYTFQQLLDRQVEKLGLDLVFHVHVPKASGETVNVFFRQNNFLVHNFDMSTTDFFQNISEDQFLDAYRAPPPRQSHLLTGHFRLDHPIFRRIDVPHVIVTTLRDPIDRMLSNYNYTLRMPHNPWHDDIATKGMSFVDYAANMYTAIGPQYSFFDDTGKGTFAPTGNATPGACLNNLLTRVSLYGLTEQFDEFSILLGYLLGRPRILAVPRGNVTTQIQNPPALPAKTSLSAAEREDLTDLLKDDIWFYREAGREYKRRISDLRLQAVFSQVLPMVQACGEAMSRVIAMKDPADPARRAFERIR
jgi:hypothetical protein